MRNLWTIYRYEIKKLTSKKLLWVTSLLCVVGIVITVTAGLFGTYYVDGEPIESHYEGFRKDQAYRKAISGRSIDENLLRETVDAYGHVPTNVFRYTLSEEYEAFARPYSDIFNLIQKIVKSFVRSLYPLEIVAEFVIRIFTKVVWLMILHGSCVDIHWFVRIVKQVDKLIENSSIINVCAVVIYVNGEV